MIDRDYMERALQLAERGRGRTSPNPLVGAVLVSPDGVVVGQGYHRRVGEAHAEAMALDEAGDRARGATLYCTLEPCCHLGRAEADAIGGGSETLVVDDPLRTPGGAYRERPLTRVVFDRRLRTPARAAILSTLAVGPVIIMTSAESADRDDLRRPLETAGADI